MNKYKFWENWKLNKLEKKGVKSILIAKKIILGNIPKKDIIASYVKGNFIRREMNKYSDVDTFTILRKSKNLAKLRTF